MSDKKNHNHMNFIKKFWSGDVSMAKSFWIFNIIIDQVQIAIFGINIRI